jgi:hypothetical protein
MFKVIDDEAIDQLKHLMKNCQVKGVILDHEVIAKILENIIVNARDFDQFLSEYNGRA